MQSFSVTNMKQHLRAVALWCVALAMSLPAVASEPHSLCWQVRSGKNEIYLMGSLHVGSKDFYPLPAPVEAAFKRASVLGVEADVSDPQSSVLAMQLGLYEGGDRVTNHLSPPLVERLKKLLPRYGMNMDALANFRPFMLMSTLVVAETMRLGYDPQAGVDLYFLQKAHARGMKIVELESVRAQLELMNSFSDKDNETMLAQTVAGIERDEVGSEFQAMVQAWRNGDSARLLQTVNDSFGGDRAAQEVIMNKLNTARNGGMAAKVESYLRSGQTHFIVVGALHLLGEQGIIERLRKKNYQITQL